ncbi:hypothetical protein ACVBE9_00020 [Eionea flava]
MKPMNQYFTSTFIMIILVIIVVIAMAYTYHQDKQYRYVLLENQRLLLELDDKSMRLQEAEKTIVALEKKSVEGILKETNKVVVSGWETLLDTVKGELDKAKERINNEAEKLLNDESVPAERQAFPPFDESPVPVIKGERT